MTGEVFLIGAGPGDPELLTIKAHNAILAADVVVYDRLVSPEIMALVPAHVRRISVGKAAGFHSVPQDRINALLVDLGRQGLRVARLKGGDPLIFGRGSEEAEELAAAGIPYTYVPGITAAQGAASATGAALTHRGLATGVRYVTGHRAADGPLDVDFASLADLDTTLVVYMGAQNMEEIARGLIAHGMPADLPVLAIASATTPREDRYVSNLSRIGADIAAHPMPAPVLFIIGRVVSLVQSQALPNSALIAAALVAHA